ncbi:MAG: nucleoside-diphosphate sugar epimerase/dehydratase [Planctomycetota bacterium]
MNRHRMRYLLIHALVIAAASGVSYYAAYLLRFAGQLEPEVRAAFEQTVGLVVAARLGVMLWFGHRHAMSRYFSFHDLLSLVRTVTAGTIGVTLLDAFVLTWVTIPRGVLLLDWGAALLGMAALNSLPRLVHDTGWNPFTRKERVTALLVGANHGGEGLLRAIRRSPRLHYQPLGFVDDCPTMVGRRIGGLPVLGRLEDIPKIAHRREVEQVLITSGELPGKQVRELVDLGAEHSFDVRVLPSYEQLLQEDVAVKPRDVAIADLLRRSPVELNTTEVRNWVRGRTVMVTGSAGSIGSEIALQLLRLGPGRVVLVDRSETGQFFLDRRLAGERAGVRHDAVLADLTDRERMDAVFRQFRPELIFHAGAYKHVPLMEANPGEAVKNIVVATRNVVDLAEEHGAAGLVMISTDKAVNPTSVMGSCKRLAEQYVQAKAEGSPCRLVTVRFGNVLDSAGSVVPLFRQQIADGGPVTVTHPEMVRYFMLIPEAAQLVIQAGAMGQGGEIFVLDMGEPVRLMDLARDMIRLSGLREGHDIEIAISGVRPGEKLYEELYGAGERHRPTPHRKIMVADSDTRRLLAVIADINRLVDVSNDAPERVNTVLGEIIPRTEAATPTPATPHRRAA